LNSPVSLPNKLVVIAGPTAVGKTRFGIDLARHFGTVILSADSRQFYRELNIGTAKPSQSELQEVDHFFIGQLSILDYYNVSKFEEDVISLLEKLFKVHKVVVMVGGSGLYIDAVCKGMDDFPDPDPALRKHLKGLMEDEGIDKLRELLLFHDPMCYNMIDLDNPNRILRALEVSISTGKPYSQQRSNPSKVRNFEIIKFALNMPRETLFNRINARVDQMMDNGLLAEVQSLKDHRHLNSLNTVGYKELFDFLDGNVPLDMAIENIKTNTRRYAKRQLTWLRRDTDYQWFSPDAIKEVINFIEE
jgi:tRNA dimethylallyltransferase